MAINQRTEAPVSKYAYRKVIRGADGKPVVIYVDAQTGQKLTSLEGYQVISAGNSRTFAPTENNTGDETVAEDIKKKVVQPEKGERTDSAMTNDRTASGTGLNNLGGFLTNPFDRSVANNYGYIDTPKAVGLAGFLPGPIGAVAGAINKGSRVSNTIANNKARETVGLDSLGVGNLLGNVLGLRDASKVADVNIGQDPYSIGFEALNRAGQTTLTPTEARRRSLIMDEPITEMTRQQGRQFRSDFKDEFPSKGFFSGVRNTANNVVSGIRGTIDRIFGGDTDFSSPVGGFPDAPSGYDGPVSYTNDPWGMNSSGSDNNSSSSGSSNSSGSSSSSSSGYGGEYDGDFGGYF